MWGMTAITKGTAMKDKKRRAGGGGGAPPSTGTYPSVVGPGIDIGCMSAGLNPAGNHLHASVLLRESFDVAGFLQITNAAGANINSQGAPEVEIADYVATVVQLETPINGAIAGGGGNPMQPGVIHTQGAPHHGDVQLIFRIANDNSTGAFRGGEFVDVAMVHNPNGVVISRINGAPPAQVPLGNVQLHFDPVRAGDTIILEFKITGHSRAGNFSSAVISSQIGGSTLKVGSCYVQVVFN